MKFERTLFDQTTQWNPPNILNKKAKDLWVKKFYFIFYYVKDAQVLLWTQSEDILK
jgi:hypothetical protein